MPVVRLDVNGPIATITIDRPEAKNALNFETVQGLLEALDRAAREPTVHAVILRGAGADFCAGGDIKDMLARRGKAVATYERLRGGLTAIVRSITQHELPVLARVDGVCLGAGLGLALSCDAILATRRATFGAPFVKVGLVPDTATSWLLPRIIGVQHARRLLLTGESIEAEEAASLGLVSQLVDDSARLDEAVASWASGFARLPRTALRDVKRLLWTNLSQPPQTAVLQEALMQAVRFTTEEHAQAVDAFLSRKGAKT